mgnify:FL=1
MDFFSEDFDNITQLSHILKLQILPVAGISWVSFCRYKGGGGKKKKLHQHPKYPFVNQIHLHACVCLYTFYVQ